jgi:hypothetical protein
VLRHIAEPVDARGHEADTWIDAASDGAMDNRLLLLVQQRDQLLLGSDVAPDTPVHCSDKTHDQSLFCCS